MAKKATYTQIKAKKNWRLHTSSNRRKFKSKSRLTAAKPRRRSTLVGNENIHTSPNRTMVQHLASFKKLISFTSKMERYEDNRLGLNTTFMPLNMVFFAFLNGSYYVNRYFQEMVKNFGILSESLNQGIKNGFKRVDSYQRKLVQSTTDMVFPSSSYKRKFDELNERITDLENEIKKIKTTHSQTSQCSNCCPQVLILPQVVPVPPPPAPPPPPPPPVQHPPPPLQFTKKPYSSNSQKQAKKEKKSLLVSLDDIKSVKLRKVSTNSDKSYKTSPADGKFVVPRQPLKDIKTNSGKKTAMPRITMADLKGVKLKRKSPGYSHVKSYLTRTPENGITVLRKNLRKVSHNRSPGGTPMNKSILETGLGLTPMITRALRKKFELANPPSASPEDFSTSPMRFRAKNQSPVQVIDCSIQSSPVLSVR